jgi:hypothetical protein
LLCGLDGQILVVQAKVTIFDSDGKAALKLRGPETKILTLTIAQEEEW